MVQLADEDIRTREVLSYTGVHLFHYPMSSCSQKLRIFLNLKGIAWEPHLINLAANENHATWFLGVNPRGLVPVLVIDGAVHIESNDIIELLDDRYPDPQLIPRGQEADMTERLRHEDALHLDLRTLSFRFLYNRTVSSKPTDVIDHYRRHGSGKADSKKQIEIDFYDRIGRDGITEDAIRNAAANFRDAFNELEDFLASNTYLLGGDLTAFDIAWYVYTKRLSLAGYPFETRHPGVFAWFNRLDLRPEFAREVAMPPQLQDIVAANRRQQEETGTTLRAIAGL